MRIKIVMLLAASMLFCADTMSAAEISSGEELQGAWYLSSGESNGKALSQAELKDGKLEIKGDQYVVMLAEIGKLEGTQKLGFKNEVKTIDAVDETDGVKQKSCLGIYAVDGDEFRVILAPAGEERPSKFQTAPGSGQWMHLWKRVKE